MGRPEDNFLKSLESLFNPPRRPSKPASGFSLESLFPGLGAKPQSPLLAALQLTPTSKTTVSQRFNTFLSRLLLTDGQRKDGQTKHGGVRKCLNKNYYGSVSQVANSMLVGSWGKATAIRPPRDIDVLFVLPYSVYQRYERRPGNKQSQLLQEVRRVLAATYPTTRMRADGQVIVVPFISYAVEVVPAFKLTSGQYWICDTHNGGCYKTTDPVAEIDAVKTSNAATSGNTRHLIRMMKRWQAHCRVPLSSFAIELVATDFLRTWAHAGKNSVYYDWMVRDFLAHLIGKASGSVFIPGTYTLYRLGDAWKSRAQTAYARARKACAYEADNKPALAGLEWQKILGTNIPL